MISFSHTITDPRAMMIHFTNTSAANTTMVCSGRLDKITFLAVSEGDDAVSKVVKVTELAILLIKCFIDSIFSNMILL